MSSDLRIPVRRALLSVSDKTGLVDLARALARHGCEILASGGTRRALDQAGIASVPVEEVSGAPEAFGGRMKTLSFGIASALLFHRERDASEATALGIDPIDLVACNLYPFARAWREGADDDALIEQIDVGGPTLLRAAAKNASHVAVLCDPSSYSAVIAELDSHQGTLGLATRRSLARAAFHHTADYDAMIAQALDDRAGESSLAIALEHGRPLRYGENAHQRGWVYRLRGATASLADMEQLHGEALSFNNLGDVQAALEAVASLQGTGVSVVKHQNPCGLAVSDHQRRALEAAWAGDPVSAFGSVVAFNRPLEPDTAAFFELAHPDRARRKFVEVMVAPEVDPQALALLAVHERLRVLRFDAARLAESGVPGLPAGWQVRFLAGACLVQEPDVTLHDRFEEVTGHAPDRDPALWEFGLAAVRQVRSNAIVVVRRCTDGTLQLLGMGAGQPNRVDSVRLAVARSRANLLAEHPGDAAAVREALGRACLVSDAYFPFPDNVEVLAEAGLRTVLQPGGSIRDRLVFRRAEELGVAMVVTGLRHFRH
jgi:phosphoribosylaminoimidazolecarboxamide formyltransferase / IMP cyclohydrolase